MRKLTSAIKTLSLFLSVTIFSLVFHLSVAQAVMGQLASEVSGWASANGFTTGESTRGSAGCLKGKRYVPLTNGSGVSGFATFYHPIYQEETGTITQMVFEFDPPVSVAQARAYAIKVAPIIGTRAATHTQKIKADASNACIGAAGGQEERYTKDWIAEFIYGTGKRVKRLVVYNDYIR